MSKELSIINREPRLHLNRGYLRKLCLRLTASSFIAKQCPRGYCISILFLPEREIQRYNVQIFGRDTVTDVITLNYSNQTPLEGQLLCGDILICPALAFQQAPRFRAEFAEELTRYLIHGMLHLCGWQDSTPEQRKRMRAAERLILRQLASCFDICALAQFKDLV